MRIGVFDSGVGGLTVLKSLSASHRFSEIIYYGDTARVPYGVRDKETIIRYCLEAVEFFSGFELDLLVVACNTASSYALEAMREKSSCDIVGVIEPGVLALKNQITDKKAKILVIGTKATIASGNYQNFLQQEGYTDIQALATPLFVPLVEEGVFSGELLECAFKFYFGGLVSMPEAVILGCTHFPLIAQPLRQYFNHGALLIHSGEAILEYLQTHYRDRLDVFYKETKMGYYASENVKKLQEIAGIWLNDRTVL